MPHERDQGLDISRCLFIDLFVTLFIKLPNYYV